MRRLDIKMAFLFLVILATITLVTACDVKPTVSLPTPEIGKSALSGYLVNREGIPLKNTTVRLAEVYREDEDSEEGAYILDTAFSPGTLTNESGFFFFQNIEPLEYVIVIGDIENNNYEIISQDNGRPKVWRAIDGQITDCGKVQTDWTTQ